VEVCGYVRLSSVYPNPVTDEDVPVKIELRNGCPSLGHWSIVTSAYRTIMEGDAFVAGKVKVTWNQRDRKGSLVSNGLYYFVLWETDGTIREMPLVIMR
jgi:hypothetical protein